MNDDFYIGYSDPAPSALARFTRTIVVALATLVAVVASAIALRQTPADPGYFGFGIAQAFEGTLSETPLPFLRTVSAGGAVTNFLLVGEGKAGLPSYARGHGGERVRFNGSLIRKGRAVMIEMNDQKSFVSLGPDAAGTPRQESVTVGQVELSGELVDTKCWFGVMRPAVGKVHRACAVRCLSGGVPPGLLVRDQHGDAVVVLLAGPGEGKLALDPQWAARVVTAEGILQFLGDVPVLHASRLRLGDVLAE